MDIAEINHLLFFIKIFRTSSQDGSFIFVFDWFSESLFWRGCDNQLNTHNMHIVKKTQNFEKFFPRDFVKNYLRKRGCIDFEKVNLKRQRQVNVQILKLFDAFINSPGIHDILLWYKSQGWLLYLYKDTNTNLLKFYGCNKNIDHHSSNVEWIIKPLLHKMLHDNGSRKTLIDTYSLSLVGFEFLPLFKKDQNGNVYQGFDGKKVCNVQSFQVCLSDEQVDLAREILSMIKMN